MSPDALLIAVKSFSSMPLGENPDTSVIAFCVAVGKGVCLAPPKLTEFATPKLWNGHGSCVGTLVLIVSSLPVSLCHPVLPVSYTHLTLPTTD